jgi:hypothetical protein
MAVDVEHHGHLFKAPSKLWNCGQGNAYVSMDTRVFLSSIGSSEVGGARVDRI